MKERQSVEDTTEAFAEIYKAYFGDVFKLVYRRIPNRQIAEDIAQDTFLAALRIKDEFLRHPKPKLWLFRTANYKMLELYKQLKCRASQPLEECPEPAAEDGHYGEIELDMAALETIDPEEWSIIKRYYLCGTTIEELAGDEAITANNMRVRLFRFREKLRRGLLR